MRSIGRMLLGVTLLFTVAACGAASPGEPLVEAVGDEAPVLVSELPRLSEAEIDALVAEASRHDEGSVQAMAGTCQASNVNSCVNSGFSSCGTWSAFATCSAACTGRVCKICEPGGGGEGPYCEFAGWQRKEEQNRFRVCFNNRGQSCTEYELSSFLDCEC
ncbi:hypothetical protein [Pyxidicoccus xibeiensis]|uniref:hypothetical protein n=1 Tax=Pyxidicoccus xibeiensis TaxID=2906759 RepID=UPI0020A6E406|nr:hypothetical protein [Pyxidicoccus xibeiensis]MCP3138745.1 hypothetical protein [Pyxidicoccus xibeiensis]